MQAPLLQLSHRLIVTILCSLSQSSELRHQRIRKNYQAPTQNVLRQANVTKHAQSVDDPLLMKKQVNVKCVNIL